MTSKEVPKEVQFCSAITCGDADTAKLLLAEINLFEQINFGMSPAFFCLWAAQNPRIAIQTLKAHFPNISLQPEVSTEVDITKILYNVLSTHPEFPSLGKRLLQNIVNVVPLTRNREDQRLIFKCCVAALKFIESNHFSQNIKEAAVKLSNTLNFYADPEFLKEEGTHEVQAMPNCLRKLDSFLNENNVSEAEALFLSNKPYLPTQRRIAQLTEQIREESLSSEKENTSLENVISFYVPSQQRQH